MDPYHVEASVPDAELLRAIARERVAPEMLGRGISAERQPVPASDESITEVVVVAVPERFIKEADLVQRAGPVGGVARADMVRTLGKPRIAQVEIASGHARPEAGGGGHHVASLRGRNGRIVERAKQHVEPLWPDDDILIDLADEGMTRFQNASIHRGRCAPSRAVNDPDFRLKAEATRTTLES